MPRFSDLLRRFGPVRLALVLIALVFAVVFLLAAVTARVECSLYGYQTERETKFGMFVGCMVKTPSGYIPRSELRTIAE